MNDLERINYSVVKLLRCPSTKTVIIEVVFHDGELASGVEPNRLHLVTTEEGVILGGCLELSDFRPSLSVSPESLEAPF